MLRDRPVGWLAACVTANRQGADGPPEGLSIALAPSEQEMPPQSLSRSDRLLQGAGKSTRIIEIGPGYSPIAAKAAGWNACAVDHTSREGLLQKYADAGVDLSAVEEVDFIWNDGPLHEAVPPQLLGSFDLLIASHLAEHVPDLIGFLVSSEKLLTSGGILSLALPDKRRCFDYFKPPTLTGDVLEAHAARRSRHSMRTAWNSFAYGVRLDGGLAVSQLPVRQTEFMNSFSVAAAVFHSFSDEKDQPYQDHHGWYFTPAGFSLIILELGQMRLIDWSVRSLHGPEGFEFFVSLHRGVEHLEEAALQSRRMALLRQLLQETREQGAPEAGDAAIQAAGVTGLQSGGAAGLRRLVHKGRAYLRRS